MGKFEYQVRILSDVGNCDNDVLNEMGAEGWELVSVVPLDQDGKLDTSFGEGDIDIQTSSVQLYFKREI